MQHLILHYHIFKNAGTSLDGILKRIFDDQFKAFDKKNPGGNISPSEVNSLIQKYQSLKVFSSHQIKFPKPKLQGYQPHQIVFLRHPLARVESCFQFEKNVQKLMSEATTLEQYVQKHLNSDHVGAIIGLQTRVLADNILFKEGGLKKLCNNTAYQSAISNLKQCPTFGIVEDYARSLDLFEVHFSNIFPEFKILEEEKGKRLNVSRDSHNKLDDALSSLKEKLHPSTYERLLEQLAPDIRLYNKAIDMFHRRIVNLGLDQ